MIERKTGALFDASLHIGALVGGGDPETAATLGRIGRLLGVAFQVRDDMLGVWGAENRTGKEPAADIRRRKKSLPIVFALNSGDAAASETVAGVYARDTVSDSGVSEVLRALDGLSAQRYCAEQAAKQKEAALALLDGLPLPEGPAAEIRETAEFLLERDF
jgi:geranylgeranyl diphosphate synthase type I